MVDREKCEDIRIIDDFVYIRTEHSTGNEIEEQESLTLWIPNKLREKVIRKNHDYPIASHWGIDKTLKLLLRYFYKPGMGTDVRQFIKGCEICKTTKWPNVIIKPPINDSLPYIRGPINCL